MSHIKGQSRHQSTLFPECLDDVIPADHHVRVIDAFVDHLDLKVLGFALVVPAETGRPAYHPGDLLKLYVYGYLHQLRSSRRLASECARNIELLWLLNRLTPSFMTIASFRANHPQALMGVCRQFVRFCREQKLFASQLVAIDGTKLQAVASRKQVMNHKRIAREQAAIDARIGEYLAEMDETDANEAEPDPAKTVNVSAALEALRNRHEDLQRIAEALDAAGSKQCVMGETDAKLMRTAQGHKVAYNGQIAVDTEHHLIVHAELTNEGNDHQQLQPMSEAAKAVLEVDALTVVADTGYANGKQARACTEAAIAPVVPRPQIVNPGNADCFTRSAFIYDASSDTYTCPAGQLLSAHRRSGVNETVQYWNAGACADCPLKAQCTRSKYRVIVRSDYEMDMEAMHQRAMDHRRYMKMRHSTVEHPFGTMKWMLGQPRFLVRGLYKARGEFALAVFGYNLKRVIQILGVDALIQQISASNSLQTPTV